MSAEWIVLYLMGAAIIGMQLANSFKLNEFYTMLARMNQNYQIDRIRDEETILKVLERLDDIRNEIPNRVEMHGDTYKMYRK